MSTRIPGGLPDDAEIDARLARVRENLLATVPRTRTHRFSRFARLVSVIAGAVVIAIGVPSVAIAVTTVEVPVECYGAATLVYPPTVVTTRLPAEPAESWVDGNGPARACAGPWAAGDLGNGPLLEQGNPVPELIGCVLGDDTLAAFPREDGPGDPKEFCAAITAPTSVEHPEGVWRMSDFPESAPVQLAQARASLNSESETHLGFSGLCNFMSAPAVLDEDGTITVDPTQGGMTFAYCDDPSERVLLDMLERGTFLVRDGGDLVVTLNGDEYVFAAVR
jgi:heat shock protein HslJ